MGNHKTITILKAMRKYENKVWKYENNSQNQKKLLGSAVQKEKFHYDSNIWK